MSGVPVELACDLLTESLAAWRVPAALNAPGDGGIVIGGNTKIRIEPAPQGSMFRWMVIDRRPQTSGAFGPGCASTSPRGA